MTHSILIKNMSFQYHSMDKRIFSDVNVSIDEHWKLALLGRNGRGKTTFMNILTNKLQYRGTIQTPLTFKYFPAFPLQEENLTVLELLLKENPNVDRWRIDYELSLIGLPPHISQRKFHQLSGGEQVRVLLVELFLNEDAFPLIDEPTNNLDKEGRNMIGNYLRMKEGFIVISHDESFLNQFVDHVLAIEKQSLTLIKGNVDVWRREKENADQLAESRNSKLKSEIKRLNEVSGKVNQWGMKRENSTKDASERRLAAKQMKRAKAIKKRTEAMVSEKEGLIDNRERVSQLKMLVKQPEKQVLYFRDFSILRDGTPLFQPISIDMYPNDRLFIEGSNGVGKSTLLQFILGVKYLETVGEYRIHLPRKISILNQKNEQDVDYASYLQQLTIKEEKQAFWHLLYQLGIDRHSFTDTSSQHWSAGEQKKVFLAHALLGENNLFIWDEVTNYLDIFVIQQLVETIKVYQPTMIAVDHNESYINAIATKTISLIPYE